MSLSAITLQTELASLLGVPQICGGTQTVVGRTATYVDVAGNLSLAIVTNA